MRRSQRLGRAETARNFAQPLNLIKENEKLGQQKGKRQSACALVSDRYVSCECCVNHSEYRYTALHVENSRWDEPAAL